MESYSNYESFRPHFQDLAIVGYYKIIKKDISRTQRILHDFYRGVVWILASLYNLQLSINLIQGALSHDTDKMANSLFILFNTLYTMCKQLAFNTRTRRVENLLKIIDGPMFAASSPYALDIMKQNALSMRRLLKTFQAAVGTCGVFWFVFPLVNRAMGQEEIKFPGYIPFDAQSSPAFELVTIYMNFIVTFQGIGNITQDCLIVNFYAQAKVQVQMLRYNLEHLTDKDDMATQKNNCIHANDAKRYNVLQQRLEKCVEHYRLIAWYSKEVQSIFDEALFIQFSLTAVVICMTVYKVVVLDLLSVEFASIFIYLVCVLVQLSIYCYYGTQFQTETNSINESVYCCDWLSLTPAFRRQLLLLMEYCKCPLTPRVGFIVPMTVDTFIKVIKSSYTLFTVLDKH